MSSDHKSVFLSYASQDARSALRIAEALRNAGIEVWFDQNELRGGDAWDAKIRRQIRECALFVPIISANTQARREGYFRLEWRLADQRTHLMSQDTAFIVPVVIDDTADQNARVPESFVAVQWTAVRDDGTAKRFAERVQSLLEPTADLARMETATPSTARGANSSPILRRGAPRWLLPATLGIVVACGALAMWRPWQRSAEAPAASEASTLVSRARALIDDDLMAVRENFRLAEELCREAVALNSTDAEAWATLARVSNGIIDSAYDTTPQRRDAARAQAERALRLAPESLEARLAMAEFFHVTADFQEAERRLRDLLKSAPLDARVTLLLADALGELKRDAEATEIRLHHPAFKGRDPRPLIDEALALRRRGLHMEAEALTDRAQALAPTPKGYRFKLVILALERDDLPAAAAYLKTVPAQILLEDAFASRAADVYLRLGESDKALEVLRRIPRDVLEEKLQVLPKGYLTGWALHIANRNAAADAEWRGALAVAEKRLAAEPNRTVWLRWKALLLALTNQSHAALETQRLYLELIGGVERNRIGHAEFLVALGEREEAWKVLEAWKPASPGAALSITATLRRCPWFAPLRSDPRLERLIARALAEKPASGSANAPSPLAAEKSVAVLAFENLSDDKANEYFSDGISDELINVLARVPGLRVIARTSSFSFKGRSVPAAEIGRALNASHLVEGTVQRDGSRARVIARLVRADNGSQLWSQRFDQDLSDIFAAQDTVAGAIANALSLRLGETKSATVARRVDPAAYELYARGRQAWNERTPEGLARADRYFEEAIARDPSFARAYVGLADVWAQNERKGRVSSENEALALVRKALELEPDLAEAHASLGLIYSISVANPRYEEAEREFETALRLNPSYASTHQWKARFLEGQARITEALAAHARAVELDPLSTRIADNHGRALLLAGQREQALSEFERALRLESGNVQARNWRTWALWESGQRAEAVAEARQLAGVDDSFAQIIASDILYKEGLRAEADRIFASIDPRTTTYPHYLLAVLSRGDDPLSHLGTTAIRRNNAVLLFFLSRFDSLHADPRFLAWIRQAGFQEIFERAQAWRGAHPQIPEEKR